MESGIFGFPVDRHRYNFFEFRNDGTFLVPSGVFLILVTGIAGGGAGARDVIIGAPHGAGGGSGAWCWLYPLIVEPLEPIRIIIGQAGATSGANGTATKIGNYIELGGGGGGGEEAVYYGAAGVPTLPKMNGFLIGPIASGVASVDSTGAKSVFGPGGTLGSDANGNPPPPTSFGAGGGGAQISAAPGRDGGPGMKGIVRIYVPLR